MLSHTDNILAVTSQVYVISYESHPSTDEPSICYLILGSDEPSICYLIRNVISYGSHPSSG